MLREIRPAILVLLLLTLITGLAYPLAMTGIAGVIFPSQAQGSLIEKDGKVIGSANSGGSNLGPTSKALADRLKEDVEKLKAENPNMPVPVDLVTTSGSGLDPDISPEAALFQVPRVAKARNLPEDRVRQLVAENTMGRLAGVLGEPRVNVLALNLALDSVRTQ
jgi:potassium-transporting ATPase KdpC subunit